MYGGGGGDWAGSVPRPPWGHLGRPRGRLTIVADKIKMKITEFVKKLQFHINDNICGQLTSILDIHQLYATPF